MSRLPTTGSDANNWGTILNDFLQQALAADGKLVTAAINPFTGLANPNLASGSTPGIVQLTNDLGGTASVPTVTGLQGNPVDATTTTSGYVLTWNSSANKWQPAAASGGSGISQAQAMAISSMRV